MSRDDGSIIVYCPTWSLLCWAISNAMWFKRKQPQQSTWGVSRVKLITMRWRNLCCCREPLKCDQRRWSHRKAEDFMGINNSICRSWNCTLFTYDLHTWLAPGGSRSALWDRPTCWLHYFSLRWLLGLLGIRRHNSTPWGKGMWVSSKKARK